MPRLLLAGHWMASAQGALAQAAGSPGLRSRRACGPVTVGVLLRLYSGAPEVTYSVTGLAA